MGMILDAISGAAGAYGKIAGEERQQAADIDKAKLLADIQTERQNALAEAAEQRKAKYAGAERERRAGIVSSVPTETEDTTSREVVETDDNYGGSVQRVAGKARPRDEVLKDISHAALKSGDTEFAKSTADIYAKENEQKGLLAQAKLNADVQKNKDNLALREKQLTQEGQIAYAKINAAIAKLAAGGGKDAEKDPAVIQAAKIVQADEKARTGKDISIVEANRMLRAAEDNPALALRFAEFRQKSFDPKQADALLEQGRADAARAGAPKGAAASAPAAPSGKAQWNDATGEVIVGGIVVGKAKSKAEAAKLAAEARNK